MEGKPVTIAKLEGGKMFLDPKAMSSILKRGEYKYEDVVVISVAGAFRKGKSFLLNFMMRYLKNEGKPGWMGKEGEPLNLKGFQWRNGCEKHTTGIVVWSKLFPVKINPDYEIYVMLMDTEGLYGYSSSLTDDTSIFLLSSLLSSVQIFNVSQNIQENDLMILEAFSECGKRASQMGVGRGYENLMFLVRDWSYPYDFRYGSKDGEEYVNRCLAIREVQHRDHKGMRKNIRSGFSKIEGFLMPHPGMKASTSQYFDGKLEDISREFKDQLKELMESLFSPRNLIEKLQKPLATGKCLSKFFKGCKMLFTYGSPLDSLYMVNALVDQAVARQRATEYYESEMEKISKDGFFLFYDSMKKEHEVVKSKALEIFFAMKKLGGKELVDENEQFLIEELDKIFNYLWGENSGVIAKKALIVATIPNIYLILRWIVTWIVDSHRSLLVL